jgi:RHS repeat-associated protein
MKNIYLLFIGLLSALSSMAQPSDVLLNTPKQGNITVQATNSISLSTGFSYSSSTGTFLAQIVKPAILDPVTYSTAINQDTYSINTSLAVGKTPGELNVSGMASYTVPLDLPKGTAGLQPTLSLNYLSSFNDGLLGIGWSIGGLSTISRVNQNLYFEAQANPIKGDLNDKYAMDGKRLILTSGTYGTDNSVYGTEIEEFSKITAKGSFGTNQGPAYFEVRTKSGLICEYGNTSDSKVHRDATCVLSWKINKITDRYGNSITFTYFESDDERPILKIQYAGSTSTLAEINFRYKQRSDMSTYVYGGREFTRDLLLDNIEMKNNGQTYKKYIMEYMLDNYAQLQKITEYSSQNQPFNPLVFSYTKLNYLLSTATYYNNSVKEHFYQGDFNGDGIMDFVTVPVKATYTTADKWKLYLGSSTGQMSSTSVEGYLDAKFKGFQTADMDGDGLCDLIKLNDSNLTFYKSTGISFTENPSILSFDYSTDKIDIIDYDGDGKREILRRIPSSKTLTYNDDPDGYWNWTDGKWYRDHPGYYGLYDLSGHQICSAYLDIVGTPIEGMAPNPGSGTSQIVDFNGDGCSDILVLFSGTYKLYEFKGTGNTLIQTFSDVNLKNSYQLYIGDFNGDGTTDIVRASSQDHGSWSMLELTKDGFKDHVINGFSNFNLHYDQNMSYSADVNGDGKMDIIFWGKGYDVNNPTNHINIAINKGNGYEYNLTEYTSPITLDLSPLSADVPLYFYCADYNGDGRDEFFYSKPGSQKCFSFALGGFSNLLCKVIDGFGAKTQILYLPMTWAPLYTRGTGATYPISDFLSAMPLVYSVAYDNGIGATTAIHYNYQGAKIHLKGKGFLGFSKVTETNTNTEISSENNYSFDSPYYYPKLTSSYTKQGSTTMFSLTNSWNESTYNESNRVFLYISPCTQTDNLKNLSVTSSVVYPSSNLYGNPTSVTKSYSSGSSKTTSFLYGDEKVSDWLIGRPTTITELSSNGSDSQTFNISRTYSATNNSPDIDQNNSGDAAYWKLDRDYDSFGNLSKEKKSATGLIESTVTYDYDSNGINLVKTTDQVGHETSYTWYPTTGLLNTQTDPFGNVVTYNYNTTDQLSSVVPSTGISTTIASSFITSGGPTNALYYVDKTGNDGSQTKVWYNRLGRELRTETRKLGGTLVKVDKQYNDKGELAQYSEPTTGTPSSWNVVGHDIYGRISQIDPIFGATTDYSYSGAITTRTVNSRQYKTTENSAGWITSTVDPGGTIANGYWPNGQIRFVTNPQGYSTTMSYDKNGNRLNMADPSVINTSWSWYGTGQLKTSTNANGQTTTYTYSPDQKVQLQNSASPEGQTSYTYYTNGLVNTITSPGGVTRSYTYELGKVKTITESVDGLTNLVTYEYDTKGRLYRKYFNGTTEYEQYDYDTNSGYLYRIQFTAAGSTATVWQLSSMDDYQRATQATIGSTAASWTYDSGSNLLSGISATGVQGYSYSFDGNTGNLNSRTNSLRTKTDYFGYDTEKLDRLTSVTGSASPALSVTYTTNKNGNIQTKSDAGTYMYDATQPYCVDQITSGLNISNDQQTIEYYSFGKVKKITEGAGATQRTADFDYNADRQRVRMILKTNGTTTRTKYYFGGSCEREVAGGVTTQYIWIGGDAYTAVAVAKKVDSGSWVVYNIFRDHLGTITHLKEGSNITEYSFDAWGRRRDKDDWTYTLTSEPALFADRGFTGHEYLEDFKLYNMNGRLYDPVVARFLSADPYIQDPSFTQNLNRYSYCLNNPLRYNDPSGEFWNWPMVWFGNWLIGGMDRWINQKQSFKQAFSPTKNPIVFSTNYSPSTNQFSHPQIDAQAIVKNQERVWKNLKELEARFSGPWRGALSGGMHNVSQNGLDFIKSWEKYRESPYHGKADADGIITVGYGHVILAGEDFSNGLSPSQATQLFNKDVSFVVNNINSMVESPLNQNQFDALTSYVFNTGSLRGTQMLMNLNSYDYGSAVKEMDIITANGIIAPGLVIRRNDEHNIFNYGIYKIHY